MTDAIHAVNLACRYGRTEAVTDLTFSVREGSLFALLGPNGAGKTTTIRMLMNIVRPSHGDATVLGVDTRRLGLREFQTFFCGAAAAGISVPGCRRSDGRLSRWLTI